MSHFMMFRKKLARISLALKKQSDTLSPLCAVQFHWLPHSADVNVGSPSISDTSIPNFSMISSANHATLWVMSVTPTGTTVGRGQVAVRHKGKEMRSFRPRESPLAFSRSWCITDAVATNSASGENRAGAVPDDWRCRCVHCRSWCHVTPPVLEMCPEVRSCETYQVASMNSSGFFGTAPSNERRNAFQVKDMDKFKNLLRCLPQRNRGASKTSSTMEGSFVVDCCRHTLQNNRRIFTVCSRF